MYFELWFYWLFQSKKKHINKEKNISANLLVAHFQFRCRLKKKNLDVVFQIGLFASSQVTSFQVKPQLCMIIYQATSHTFNSSSFSYCPHKLSSCTAGATLTTCRLILQSNGRKLEQTDNNKAKIVRDEKIK